MAARQDTQQTLITHLSHPQTGLNYNAQTTGYYLLMLNVTYIGMTKILSSRLERYEEE